MMVENAKKNMQMAINTGPNPPNAWLNAAWVRGGAGHLGIRPEVMSTRPVRVSTTKVSMNTLGWPRRPAHAGG